MIIDGSDLEPYRDASTSIFTAFRDIVKNLHGDNAVQRGGMDECFADITSAVEKEVADTRSSELLHETKASDLWIYGDDEMSSTVKIVEDQTGAASIVSLTFTKGYDCDSWGSKQERDLCVQKLHLAAKMAKKIQQEIKSSTNFSTTVGISVSPMLAKIASSLKKPWSCNVLYPWRSHGIIESMPLRRLPGLGSKTLRSLTPLLEKYHSGRKEDFWKCRDLLEIPRYAIQSCLYRNENSGFCDLLINRCRGRDSARVFDDKGIPSKTISVEDSFKRGSVTSIEKVIQNIDPLITRILRLLDKRTEQSSMPKDSFPKVIRLTARVVDPSINNIHRPFRNVSKQTKFNGKAILEMKEIKEKEDMLRKIVVALVTVLNNIQDRLDVTRLNLAMTSFVDIHAVVSKRSISHGKESIACYFQPKPDVRTNEIV
jgi:nucleotidyltransferase/DNA polymerase involved in DNA repair